MSLIPLDGVVAANRCLSGTGSPWCCVATCTTGCWSH